MKIPFKLVIVGALLLGCSDDTDMQEANMVDAPPSTAIYEVTFTGTWSEASHPLEFPSGRDHFSSAVGMVHKEGVELFEPGQLASEGIEAMAESGANGDLSNEVGILVSDGQALEYFSGGGLSDGLSQRSFEITVTSEFPRVSVVSMIAPSPDWFVAARNIELFSNGEFVEELTYEADTYDAGTDSGESFTSPNADTQPAEQIFRISEMPLGDGTSVSPALASFRFVRKQ